MSIANFVFKKMKKDMFYQERLSENMFNYIWIQKV